MGQPPSRAVPRHTMNQATPSNPAVTESEATHVVPGALSWRSFCLALAVLLAIFVFTNPIWEEHDMNAWNRNIWWSYLPIPLIIGALLAFERKFSWPALALEVMKMTFVKFVITYSMASVIWEFRGAPGTGLPEMTASTDSQLPAFEVHPVPGDVTVWKASDLCGVAGVLRDSEGVPLANTLVYVHSGLEGARFAPPTEPAKFRNAGVGFTPVNQVIQTHQVVSLESASGELHTAVFDARDQRRRVLNVAVRPGEPRELMFDAALGALALTCSVHGKAEAAANLLLLHHPFWTFTDAKGAFQLDGLPPGSLQFAMERSGATVQLEQLELAPGSQSKVEWRATP